MPSRRSPTTSRALSFLDIGMQGMDGYEVARRVRAQPALANVTLIALTGWGQEDDRRRSREAGFDYHLIKPADIAALQSLLTSLESESSGVNRRVLPPADLPA
jgi:CheY-like chemotaxis protein